MRSFTFLPSQSFPSMMTASQSHTTSLRLLRLQAQRSAKLSSIHSPDPMSPRHSSSRASTTTLSVRAFLSSWWNLFTGPPLAKREADVRWSSSVFRSTRMRNSGLSMSYCRAMPVLFLELRIPWWCDALQLGELVNSTRSSSPWVAKRSMGWIGMTFGGAYDTRRWYTQPVLHSRFNVYWLLKIEIAVRVNGLNDFQWLFKSIMLFCQVHHRLRELPVPIYTTPC